LTAPANGATFTAPATITVDATASDADGTIARVDFYRDATLIGSDATSPYSVTWSSVPAGSYTLTAVARDNDGATTTSSARTVTVVAATTASKSVMFSASPDHNTLVNSYLIEIFTAGANTSTAKPIASRDLGKPAVAKGECTADVTSLIGALAPGTYQVTVAAVGAGGKARSAPFSLTR
jgi:chitinase